MKPFPLVPVNFVLSARAADEINRLTCYLQTQEGKEYVPVILWDESYDEIRKRLTSSGFGLGWHERIEVPGNLLQRIGNVEILFAIDQRQAKNFDGETIDFIDGNFRFADGRESAD
jgi:hypothetical protein